MEITDVSNRNMLEEHFGGDLDKYFDNRVFTSAMAVLNEIRDILPHFDELGCIPLDDDSVIHVALFVDEDEDPIELLSIWFRNSMWGVQFESNDIDDISVMYEDSDPFIESASDLFVWDMRALEVLKK